MLKKFSKHLIKNKIHSSVTLLFLGSVCFLFINTYKQSTLSTTPSYRSGNFGTPGVTTPLNHPSGRTDGIFYKATTDTFHLFGGYGYDEEGEIGWLNDLWKFNINTGDWTWISGSNEVNQLGTYGQQGVPSNQNHPGARRALAYWTDEDGDLFIFGGFGVTESREWGALNDLWKYEFQTGNWTWLSGSQDSNTTGVYGQQGIPDPQNIPGSRAESIFFERSDGCFYLFGGKGYNAVEEDLLNDLWKYDPQTNLWTWLDGSTTDTALPVYGELGIPGDEVQPGGRHLSAHWLDQNEDLYFFGGFSWYTFRPELPGLSFISITMEIWKYNFSTNQWEWVKEFVGNALDNLTNYGELGVENTSNTPGIRTRITHWKNSNDQCFYFFSGTSHVEDFSPGYRTVAANRFNDIWKYNPIANNWTWVGGDQLTFQPVSYESNLQPGSRNGGMTAFLNPNELILFAGHGNQTEKTMDYFNDVWKLNLTTYRWTLVDRQVIPGPFDFMQLH